MKTLKLSSLFVLLLSFGFAFQACDQLFPLEESEMYAYKATEASKAVDLVDSEWTDGIFNTGGLAWFRYEATAGTFYKVYMNNCSDGDGNKKAFSCLDAYAEDLVTSYFIEKTSMYYKYELLRPEKDGYIYFKVYMSDYSSVETFDRDYNYAIKCEEYPVPVLAEGVWENGNIENGNDQWFKAKLDAGKMYKFNMNNLYEGDNSKTAYSYMTAYKEDLSTEYFSADKYMYSEPNYVSSSEDVYVYLKISVDRYYSDNSFSIKYEEL